MSLVQQKWTKLEELTQAFFPSGSFFQQLQDTGFADLLCTNTASTFLRVQRQILKQAD